MKTISTHFATFKTEYRDQHREEKRVEENEETKDVSEKWDIGVERAGRSSCTRARVTYEL